MTFLIVSKAITIVNMSHDVCGVMNRTGVICGECKKNFSTAINSYQFICTPCNDETNFAKNIIKFMVFAYVPYIILSAILVLFNLKLTSSASNGFILFAQMMSLNIFNISNSARVKIDTFDIDKAYLFVYGIFNFKSFADVIWNHFVLVKISQLSMCFLCNTHQLCFLF